MRKIQVIGNLTRDAEVRELPSGKKVINFDVAVNESWRDKGTNEIKKRTTYVKCAIWRENTKVVQYLTKGGKVYVEGTPDVEVYVNKEGKAVGNVKINVHNTDNGLILLGGKKSEEQQGGGSQDNETLIPTPDDDLPF